MGARIKTVMFIREIAEGEKLAPQSRAIVESTIAAHGLNTEVTVEQVVAAMTPHVTTRQPMERIFGYYAPKLEEAGYISVERSEVASAADGEKPKRKKKEKAGEDVSGELSDDVDEADELDADEDEDEDEDDVKDEDAA